MKPAEWLSAIAGFLLSVAVIATVIDCVCFDRSFYEAEYQKNDTVSFTGMSPEDNLAASDTLLEYLRGQRDDIVCTADINGTEREVFNERETLHMIDVRALYQTAVKVRNICLAVSAVLFILAVLIGKQKLFTVLWNGWRRGILLTAGMVLFIAIWALADFDQFWTNFHLLLFDNDLWLLDPNTSVMINLFPGTFFFDMVIRIILLTAGVHAAIIGVFWALGRNKG